jgi:hypothetical protein
MPPAPWNGNLNMNKPPNGVWAPPRPDGRCGASFGWTGCQVGLCCDSSEHCGPNCI